MPRPTISCARWYDPILTLLWAAATYALLRHTLPDGLTFTCLFVGITMLPMLAREAWRNRENFRGAQPLALAHVATQWLGVAAGIAAMYGFYWLFPFARERFFDPLRAAAPLAAPLLVLAFAALALECRRFGPEKNAPWAFGRLLLGHWQDADWQLLRDGAFVWLIRAVFLPLNFCSLHASLTGLHAQEHYLLQPAEAWPQFHAAAMRLMYVLLIVTIVPGYLFGSRLLGTHTRRTNQTWLAWAVMMACYPPLVFPVFYKVFAYMPLIPGPFYMRPWVHMLEGTGWLLYAWGAAILLSELLHMLGEAILGLRASNLAHRGIVTNGPFRYTRHPVYVSKCVGWLLSSCPFFMAGDALDCLRMSLLFVGVCGIYFLRSISEERIFADDKDYVAYAHWVDAHGWFAWFGKRMPWLTFGWRYKRWQLQGL